MKIFCVTETNGQYEVRLSFEAKLKKRNIVADNLTIEEANREKDAHI